MAFSMAFSTALISVTDLGHSAHRADGRQRAAGVARSRARAASSAVSARASFSVPSLGQAARSAARSVDEENERRAHDHHAEQDRVGDERVARVEAVRGRQELVEHDRDHHSADEAEEHAIHALVELPLQQRPANQRADRLGHAREHRPEECALAVARRVVDGDRDAEALGDVVDADRDRERRADRRVVERRYERREALRAAGMGGNIGAERRGGK